MEEESIPEMGICVIKQEAEDPDEDTDVNTPVQNEYEDMEMTNQYNDTGIQNQNDEAKIDNRYEDTGAKNQGQDVEMKNQFQDVGTKDQFQDVDIKNQFQDVDIKNQFQDVDIKNEYGTPMTLRNRNRPSTGQSNSRTDRPNGPIDESGSPIDQSDIKVVPVGQSDVKIVSISRSGAIDPSTPNPNANSMSYIPAALHEFYRQAASVNNKGDFTCALCSKLLKCRSARDMRDHALSHGGAHWASAFRCLLCSYHSHSRRSVSKHITSSHLVPDGVQCLPGELMENETITRQEELMALVRDCFPANKSSKTARTSNNNTNNYDELPANEMLNQLESGNGNFDTTGEIRQNVYEPVRTVNRADHENKGQASEDQYEDEEGSGMNWPNEMSHENGMKPPQGGAGGIVEGWTVMDDAADETSPNDPEAVTARNTLQYSNYQVPNSTTTPGHPPVLQGLLRDFEFHPDPYGDGTSRVPVQASNSSSYYGVSSTMELEDDPRALIERLLNVVAPDVARFLLEEAIRNRAIASGHMTVRVPITSRQHTAPPQMVRHNYQPMRTVVKTPVPIQPPKPQQQQQNATTNRLKSEHRLGKIGVFKCNECNSLFKRRRYLERHVRARHRQHCYRCTMPGCSFTNARELWYVRRHHAKHHGNVTDLVCRVCCKRFPNSDELTSRHHPCCSMTPKGPAECDASTSKQ